jgi:hypothetical protein
VLYSSKRIGAAALYVNNAAYGLTDKEDTLGNQYHPGEIPLTAHRAAGTGTEAFGRANESLRPRGQPVEIPMSVEAAFDQEDEQGQRHSDLKAAFGIVVACIFGVIVWAALAGMWFVLVRL